MKTTISVNNIRCGGCSNSIHKSLGEVNGVFGVEVNIPAGEITVDHTDEVLRETIAEKLLSMGYPEVGTTSGFKAVKASITSLGSCMIGKISK